MATDTMFSPLNAIISDAEKRFDDAIYRTQRGKTNTAQELWADLAIAQESPGDGLVSGLTCAGILNELKARKQISGW